MTITLKKAALTVTLASLVTLGGATVALGAPSQGLFPLASSTGCQGLRSACMPGQWPVCPADRSLGGLQAAPSAGIPCPSPYYVDDDGDGICDNAGQGLGQGQCCDQSQRLGRGQGAGQGLGQGQRGNGAGQGNRWRQ